MTEDRDQETGQSEGESREESENQPSPPPAPKQPVSEEMIDLTEPTPDSRQTRPDRDN